MVLEHILLGMLRTPASGYELRAAFQQSVRHIWSAELSQIYPTLDRMTRRGWLRRSLAKSRRGPARRMYALTPAGRVELRRWLREEPILGTERFAYLAQLFFMDELGDKAEAQRFMTELRRKLAVWLQQLEEIEAQFAAEGPADNLPDPDFFQYLTLRMGVRAITAKIEWCDESIKRLRSRAKKRRK
jgi:PadR family transcriptional regulator AphA